MNSKTRSTEREIGGIIPRRRLQKDSFIDVLYVLLNETYQESLPRERVNSEDPNVLDLYRNQSL